MGWFTSLTPEQRQRIAAARAAKEILTKNNTEPSAEEVLKLTEFFLEEHGRPANRSSHGGVDF